jgi:hypothetical protein
MTAKLCHLLQPGFGTAWPALALAALLILTASLGGCASFDASRISVNVDPAEFTSYGW